MLLLFVLVGCNTIPRSTGNDPLRTTATPSAGTYPEKNAPLIVLTTNRSAMVYITVDGTLPRKGFPNTFALRSPVRGIPIAFDGMPLRFFAEDDLGNREETRLAVYHLDRPPKTTVKPPAGLYAHPVTVTLTASEPATVYYTIDGSEPVPANPNASSGESPLGGIKIQRTTTLRFASIDPAGNTEKTKTASYQIDTVPPKVDVTPQSGTYDSPLDVEITISNDTGKIYYTLGGGTPDPKDVSGRTLFAAGSLKMTLTKSTIIHYLAEDKVGNREADLPARGYKELSYILDCLPTVSASPAPGAYPGKTLGISFSGHPDGGTIFFKQDNGATQTYSTPIVLQDVPGANFEVWNDAVVGGSCGAGIQSGNHLTLAYTLGADIPSAVYSEDFTSTALLDASATTAVVDTALGEVRLPTKPPKLVRKIENNVFHTAASLLLPRVVYSQMQPGSILAVEGGGLVAQGSGATVNNNVTGLKIYSQTDMNPTTGGSPDITYQATYTPSDLLTGGAYFDVAAIRSGDGVNLAAVARAGQVQFIDISTLTSPKPASANLSLGVAPAPPVLLGRDDVPKRLYVADGGGGDLTLTSYDIDSTTTTTQKAQLTFANDMPIDMAVNDDIPFAADYNSVLVLSGNCNIYRVEAAANGGLSKNGTLDTVNICKGGTDLPRRIAAFQDSSASEYLFATVVPGGGGGIVAMAKLTGNVLDGTWTNILPATLGTQIGGIQVVPLLGAGYVLAVFDGSMMRLYDLQNIATLPAGGTLPVLGTYDLGTRNGYDAVHVGSGFLVSTLSQVPQGGGLAAFSIPITVRDTVASAVVQSVNVNPRIGTNLTSVQFLEAVNSANVGVIDYEVKIGSGGFVPLSPGSSLAVSSSTDSLIWKATLKKSGTENPILDRVKFKLTYPEGQ